MVSGAFRENLPHKTSIIIPEGPGVPVVGAVVTLGSPGVTRSVGIVSVSSSSTPGPKHRSLSS